MILIAGVVVAAVATVVLYVRHVVRETDERTGGGDYFDAYPDTQYEYFDAIAGPEGAAEDEAK